MNLSVEELKNRVKGARDRFELLRLREDITTFMAALNSRNFSRATRTVLKTCS